MHTMKTHVPAGTLTYMQPDIGCSGSRRLPPCCACVCVGVWTPGWLLSAIADCCCGTRGDGSIGAERFLNDGVWLLVADLCHPFTTPQWYGLCKQAGWGI